VTNPNALIQVIKNTHHMMGGNMKYDAKVHH
jgi:hypothetical protein